MVHFNRRKFIKASTLLMAASFAPPIFNLKVNKPLLSFSTLGCPDWNFQKITDFAVQNNYTGIELRGILKEMDLTKCKEFNTPQNMAATLAIMNDKNLSFVDLGSSAMMHIAESVERQKNLDEAKRFIDLAQQINCPYVRVFPNNLPKDKDKNATIELIANGLQQLGNHAKDSNVTVLMETHGDLVHTDDILKVMESTANEHTGLVWDVTNMWVITKEPPVEVYEKIKKYIHHTHIKDAIVDGDTITYKFLGKGQVPIFTAIDALSKDGYKGYYSFEWEKLWHPEIAEPEIALDDYPKAMMAHFNQ
jgi:sugar phosphate isomerase/epimerase